MAGTPKSLTSQSKRFIEAAREAGCSEDEAVFDENMKRIAKAEPPPHGSKKTETKKPGQ